jgi:hypothetical protein
MDAHQHAVQSPLVQPHLKEAPHSGQILSLPSPSAEAVEDIEKESGNHSSLDRLPAAEIGRSDTICVRHSPFMSKDTLYTYRI